MIHIQQAHIDLYHIPFVQPFRTGFGTLTTIPNIVVTLVDSAGRRGLGEASVMALPLYNHECATTTMAMLEQVFLPRILEQGHFNSPEELDALLAPLRGHPVTRSACSMAMYDLFAQEAALPLAHYLGGRDGHKRRSETVSVHDHPTGAVAEAQRYVDAGIRDLKLKIAPGKDVTYVQALREQFPAIGLIVDANASYQWTQEHREVLAALDAMGLDAIEQPLCYEDIVHHGTLQARLNTPLSLDESVISMYSFDLALELQAMQTFNLKLARVGGYTPALRMLEECKAQNLPVWIGGMLETPIGLGHNLALMSREECIFPADCLAQWHYLKDFAQMYEVLPCTMTADGLELRFDRPGLGVTLREEVMAPFRVARVVVSS